MTKYSKLWYALGAVLLAVLTGINTDGSGVALNDGLDKGEVIVVVGMFAAAVGVWATPGVPGWRQAKSIAYGVVVLLAVLPISAIVDGLDVGEISMLVTALLGYLGIRLTPNHGDALDALTPGGKGYAPAARR